LCAKHLRTSRETLARYVPLFVSATAVKPRSFASSDIIDRSLDRWLDG